MQLFHPHSKSLSVRILLAVLLSFFFNLDVESANSASEPGTITIVLEGEPANLDFSDAADSRVGQVVRR